MRTVVGLSLLLALTITDHGGAFADQVATPVREDSRDQDRAAIRSHIEKIFQAFVDRDCATLRATHSRDWIGFTTRARQIARGLDAYLKYAAFCQDAGPGPHMTSYSLTEIDYQFRGDIALVAYTAETNGTTWEHAKLRSLDVYEKRDSSWIQIGSNVSVHPDTVDEQLKRQSAPAQPKP